MNVAVIGSGGREHALAWKLAASPALDVLYCMPGNPGTEGLAENVELDPNDVAAVVRACRERAVNLVVVGPEDPLAAGLADELRAVGVLVVGPGKEAARLEADKWFAKELMRQQAVPTAEARAFTNFEVAKEFVESRAAPCVVKAAGLAKGKGVVVAYRVSDALEALDVCLKQKAFGPAGQRVVIEELLTGPEVSVLAFVGGRSLYLLPPCQDHKPIDDGNTGPMTGGMGAFCPTPTITPALLAQVEREVFIPVLDGLRRDNVEYRGVLYAGLMLTAAGPRVLEFNVRFGDPECQPLMMRLRGDLVKTFAALADNQLERAVETLRWDARPALCVVAASGGYPGKYKTGVPIEGADPSPRDADVQVFHAGTARDASGALVTAGGRVLTVCALGETMPDARAAAYARLEGVRFDGMRYRRDIGAMPTFAPR